MLLKALQFQELKKKITALYIPMQKRHNGPTSSADLDSLIEKMKSNKKS